MLLSSFFAFAQFGIMPVYATTTYLSSDFESFPVPFSVGSGGGGVDPAKTGEQKHAGTYSAVVNTSSASQYSYFSNTTFSAITGAVHMGVWIYPDNSNPSQNAGGLIVFSGYNGSAYGIIAQLNYTGSTYTLLNQRVGPVFDTIVTGISGNVWHHVEAYEASDQTLIHYYIDGVNASSSFVPSGTNNKPTGTYIGDQSGVDKYGKMFYDDLAFDDTAEPSSATPEYQYVTQTSNVDGSADVGTHSSFVAQQAGPDLTNDTLTEANTAAPTAEAYSYCNNNGGVWTNPANAYDADIATSASYTWTTAGYSAYLTLNLTYVTLGSKIQYLVQRSNTVITTMDIDIANQTGSWLNVFSTTPTYNSYANATFTKAQYTAMRYRFSKTGGASRVAYVNETQGVNDTVVNVNYQLAIEEQWTNANYTRANRELDIFMGPFNSSTNPYPPFEQIFVQWWNTTSSTWLNITGLNNLASNSWNNASVTTYLTASTFTIQFLDQNRTLDTVANTWAKDCALLHTWDTSGVNVAYSPNQTSTVSESHSKTAENKYASSSAVQLSSILSPFIVDRPFSLFGTNTLSSVASKGIEKGFTSLGILIVQGFNSMAAEIHVGQFTYALSSLIHILAPSGPSDDWPMFRHDVAHTGYSTSAPSSGVQLWNFTTGDSRGTGSSPAIVNGVVYIGGSEDDQVYALNASTGAKLWNYTLGNIAWSSPAVDGGVVYVGSDDGQVYALNCSTGSKIWNYTTGDVVDGSPTVVNGVVYVGSRDDRVYALNASTGIQLWNYTTSMWIYSSPAVVGGIVYIGSWDDQLYALNASTGSKLWNYTTGNVILSSPAVASGVVYVASDDNHFYALNSSTGVQLWNYTGSSDFSSSSSPAVVGSVVYMSGSNDKQVYALDASTGAKLWNFTTGAAIIDSSPAVVNGVVYIGSQDKNLYALDASSGAKLWNYTTGDNVRSSPAIVNGIVYFGSRDGHIYALGTYSPLLSIGFSKELGFQSTGIISLFASGLSGIERAFSSQGSINLLSFASPSFEVSLGQQFSYAVSSVSSLLSSVSAGFERLFGSSGIVQVSASSGLGRENGFSSSGLLTLSGVGSFGHENLFSSSGLIILSGLGSKSAENLFSPTGTLTILGLGSKNSEKTFTLTSLITLLSSTSKAVENLFSSSQTLNILSLKSMGLERAFATTGLITVLSSASSGVERGFSSLATITVSSLSSISKELGFQMSSSVTILNLITETFQTYAAQQYAFSLSETSILSGLSSRGLERLFQSSNTITILSKLASSVERGFSTSEIIQMVSSLGRASENLFGLSGNVQVSALSVFGRERSFGLTGTLLVFSTVVSSFQTYTPQAYAFAISEIETLSGSARYSMERLFSASNIVSISALSSLGLEKGFISTEILQILGVNTFGVERAFSSTEQITLDSFNSSLFELHVNAAYTFFISELSTVLANGESNVENSFTFSESIRIFDLPGAFGNLALYPPTLGTTGILLYPPSQSSGFFNVQPILNVEAYFTTIVSSFTSFYTFLLLLAYPAHINAVCVPPQTTTVDVNVTSTFTVGDLNFSETVMRTTSGNQTVSMSVLVPLPLLGKSSYSYHVATTYMVGQTLIGESAYDGILTVQQWWFYLWAGIVSALTLTFVGLCAGTYLYRRKKLRNKLKAERAKQTIQRQQQTIQRQQQTIRSLSRR